MLMNPRGALANLHQRMRDAGCDVAPHWARGAKLFVPFTVEQVEQARSSQSCLEPVFDVDGSIWLALVLSFSFSRPSSDGVGFVDASLASLEGPEQDGRVDSAPAFIPLIA